MIKNFKLIIEYDGSLFHGWQRQKKDRTVQETIENTISVMTKQPVNLIGSGRTDAGVHALGQVANFQSNTKITPEIFKKGLNSLLPDDIVIISCEQADLSFHARFAVKSKCYRYRLLNRLTPSAIARQYAWFIRKKLDIESMQYAALALIGTNDFKSFEGAGSPRRTSIRTLLKTEIIKKDKGLVDCEFTADGFLRYMVRNITGTLVDVGLGKITPKQVQKILESKNRDIAGITAPSHGLFLVKVNY